MAQQKKLLLININKNKDTDVRKLLICDNEHKKKKYCIRETEDNACNLIRHVHSKNSFICSPQINKIKVPNHSTGEEEKMRKRPNLQINQTIDVPAKRTHFANIKMSSDDTPTTEENQVQTDSNTNKNQLRQIQSKFSEISVNSNSFANNNSDGIVHNNNDNVNANFTTKKSDIQLIDRDLSPRNSSRLIVSSENDELALDCTPYGINLVTENKGSITCTVHNNDYSAHEVKLKCLGLESTGIYCYINGTPNADEILVEASSVKSFRVSAIIPPIPTLVKGLYPFTISAN